MQECDSLSFSSSSRASNIYIPGQKICDKSDTIVAGKGTDERNGCVFSLVVGYLDTTATKDGQMVINVKTNTSQNLVPVVGGLVTGKITQATPRFCKVAILTVEENIFEIPFRGLLRKEDIRATEKDKVEIHKCYRPGDVVLCRVISIGDTASYILSTAENELGVILSYSENGNEPMVPISWTEMQCPKTFVKEFRKVAKPSKHYIESLQVTAQQNGAV